MNKGIEIAKTVLLGVVAALLLVNILVSNRDQENSPRVQYVDSQRYSATVDSNTIVFVDHQEGVVKLFGGANIKTPAITIEFNPSDSI